MNNPKVNVVVGGHRNEYHSTYKTYILRGGIPFADQVIMPDTKYVIKYDFDLGGGAFDLDFSNADTHTVAEVTYYYIPFTADGSKYTLIDDTLVFIDAEWNGLSVREIKPEKGTLFMIASITGGLHKNGYGINVVTVPENCILEFDGGSLDNGVIVGQDTVYINVGDVEIWGKNLILEGTWREKGAHIDVDEELSDDSENPVQNKVVKNALDGINSNIDRLDQKINDDEYTWEANISSLRDDASSEQDAREREDAAIRDEIASERQTRQENDTDLSNSIRGLEEDVNDRYTKAEVNNLISRTPETNVVVVEGQQGVDPTTLLPAQGDDNTLYRIMSEDGTSFSEYGWNGTQYKLLSVSNTGVDNAPKPKSSKFVTSGGIAESLNIMELRNGSIGNLLNTNSVTTGWFRTKGKTLFTIETNRPNGANCYYGFGWAVTSSENDCADINKQISMYEGIVDYAEQSLFNKNKVLDIISYNTGIGVCFTISEFDISTAETKVLRVSDFDGYYVKIVPQERINLPILFGSTQEESISKATFYNGSLGNKNNPNAVHTDFIYIPYKGDFYLSITRPNSDGCHYIYSLALTSSYNDVNGDRDNDTGLKGYITETSYTRDNKSLNLSQYSNLVGAAITIMEESIDGTIIPLRKSDMAGYEVKVLIKQYNSSKDPTIRCLLHNGSLGNTNNLYAVTTDIFPTLDFDKFTIKVTRPNTEGCHYEFSFAGAGKDNGVTTGYSGQVPMYEVNEASGRKNVFYKSDARSVGYTISIWEKSDTTGELHALRIVDFEDYAVIVERSNYSINNVVDRNIDKYPMLCNACRIRKTSETYKDFQMLIVTDSHDDNLVVKNAIEITNGFDTIDALIHCGDITDHITIDQNVDSLWKNIVAECNKPFYFVVGNHDGGEYPYIDFHPSKAQIFTSFIQPIIDAGYLKFGEYVQNKCYYFRDFVVNKIRLIVLDEYESPITPDTIDETYWRKVTYNSSYDNYAWNTNYTAGSKVNVPGYTEYSFEAVSDVNTGLYYNHGEAPKYKYPRQKRWISQEQALWFISALKNTPANYGVIVAIHSPFSFNAEKFECKFSQIEDLDISGNDEYMTNDFVADVVNAFQNKTSVNLSCVSSENGIASYSVNADFRRVSDSVYFHSFVGGHLHRDYVWKHTEYRQYQVTPTCANANFVPQFIGSDIRRSAADGLAKDSLTVVSYRHFDDINGLAMVKVGVNTTEGGKKRDFEVLEI